MDKKLVYIAGFGVIIIAIIIAGILLATSTRHDTRTEQTDVRNISISVVEPPIRTSTADMAELSYTLETSRFGDHELSLSRVEILNADTKGIIETLEGESLTQAYSSADDTKNPRVAVRLQIREDDMPDSIIHQLYFISEGRAILPFSRTGGEIDL